MFIVPQQVRAFAFGGMIYGIASMAQCSDKLFCQGDFILYDEHSHNSLLS